MNERSATVLRCVVAGWLVYTGVSLIYEVAMAKPNNMILMICFGAFFTVFGIGFATLTIRRYRADMKEDAQDGVAELEEETQGNAGYMEADGTVDETVSAKRGAGVANVDLKASVNTGMSGESETAETEKEAAGEDTEAVSEEVLQEPEEDTSKTELTTEEKE